MRSFPVPDPGTPDLRSPVRYLAWVARQQRGSLLAGAFWGVLWMGAQAISPAALGKAVDAGIRHRNAHALVGWSAALLGLGLLSALAGMMRHRCAVTNYLAGVWRSQQVILRHASRLGASLPERIAPSEAATISAVDGPSIGRTLDVTARATGALVSFVVVAILLLTTSTILGLVVLVGVPALVLGIGPLLGPLQRRQSDLRVVLTEASGLAADTVSGLRVLRGIGGEAELAQRYRSASQRVRTAGVQVAKIEATLEALQVLLPGIFVVVVTVIGARLAVEGRITAGQLVAFYGYAAFLVTPLRTATEMADKATRAIVAAGRIIGLLRLEPLRTEPTAPAPDPSYDEALVDPVSGLAVVPGELLAVACAEPSEGSALAQRLGGMIPSETSLGSTRLDDLALSTVRSRLLVSDQTPWLFRGPFRRVLDPQGKWDDEALLEGLGWASAEDVIDALGDGLDTELEERARELSGGQRQRVVLARALLQCTSVLILDEPTSSVDAHTESRIATRLRDARAGRTTVIISTSPLVLEQADRVVLLLDDAVVAEGSHSALLRDPRYRAVVAREGALT